MISLLICEAYARNTINELVRQSNTQTLSSLIESLGLSKSIFRTATPQELRDWEENTEEWRLGRIRRKYLYHILEQDIGAIIALDLALSVYIFPQLEQLLCGYTGLSAVSLEMAYQVAYGEDFVYDHKAFDKSAKLLMQLMDFGTGEQFFRAPIKCDRRLMGYLSADDTLDSMISDYAALYFPEDELHPTFAKEKIVDEIEVLLRQSCTENIPFYLQLAGEKGSGKKFLLKKAASRVGKGFVFVDYAEMVGLTPPELTASLASIRREALFYNMGVCFYHVPISSKAENELNLFVRNCLRDSIRHQGFICFCTEDDFPIYSGLQIDTELISIGSYTRNDRILLWQGFWKLYGLQATLDAVSYATKLKLSPYEIQKTVLQLSRWERGGQVLDDAKVAQAGFHVAPPAQGNVKRIEVQYTLDDLKLPDDQKQKLKAICAHVTHRYKVYDEWNMESRYAYGKNVSALFVGPPGTGKTMAVHVLSTMLGIPLYRIDVSQVVDKYIGETEKRLEQIFIAAEKSNSILFFDEADAIFGKRSEVNDAKDKYANTEVSYILQRIEQYDGIVILATNYKKNIDEAFMRRMRYLIEFTLPGEELRRAIWESSFAKEVPLSGVDFGYLARQFELSGGSIKNIVLNATFLAAAEDQPVNMKHILDSIRGENLKLGKSMLKQDFAEYGELF